MPQSTASLDTHAQSPETGQTKAILGSVRVANHRGEHANIYVNGRWRGWVGAHSFVELYVGDPPGTVTRVVAQCPSGFYVWQDFVWDVWKGYLSLY